MNRSVAMPKLFVPIGLVLASSSALAGNPFENFTPLTTSAGPTADESMPITFGNPAFVQRSIADRETQLAAGKPNSGAWDMITLNESGRDKGRYLFCEGRCPRARPPADRLSGAGQARARAARAC